MLCEVNEETAKAATADNSEPNETSTPEKGRVWRWRNNSVGPRKNSDGPVLRATVKPVKRFIPELSGIASTSTPAQQTNAQSNSKQVPSAINDDSANKCDTELKPKVKPSLPQASQPCNKKKRVREQWSIEDKNHFFEAVAVHGKDFEAIQKAIAHKHKKRGDETVVKTKDQVRHLYYRTWTTISKLLDHETFPNQNGKGTQELFAVINYGELRKKLGGYLLKKKGIMKLNELINCGSTSVRIKGKNYRIKTPSCKALKRIHDKKDAIKKSSIMETRRIKLPLRIDLEIHPLSINAWNHVHLLAHNPRIRFNVPLDCRMSHLLLYLAKKWKPLSSKMFEVAEHGYIKANFSMHKPHSQSTSLELLEILVPPEATVKALVQVHEVVTTKTHCVVSYAMHKTGKQASTSRKKKKCLHSSEQPENAPITATEICVSSEDEGALTDRLSDAEDHGLSSYQENHQMLCSENTPIDTVEFAGQPVSSALVSLVKPSNSTSSRDEIVLETDSYMNSFQQVAEISAENFDEDSCPTVDSANSTESASPNIFDPDVVLNDILQDKDKTNIVDSLLPDCSDANIQATTNNAENNATSSDLCESQSNHTDSTNTDYDVLIHNSLPCKENELNKTTEMCSTVSVPNEAVILNVAKPATTSSPSVHKTLSELSVDNNSCENVDVDKSEEDVNNNICQYSESHNSVDFETLPVQKYWNSENVGEITLAEVFLMLGKPSTFKLCYHWKKDSPHDDSFTDKLPVEHLNDKPPTGVTALLQAATLLLNKIKKDSTDGNTKQNNLNKDQNKSSTSKKDKMKINVGIQCHLSDKNSGSGTGNNSTPSSTTKKAHGRGSSKFTTPISSIDPFAVPNIPPTRKRKLHNSLASSQMLDAREIQQRAQVRLGDVQFRKQMEALNRRIDLFRPQNRNRTTRKPFIVQRSMMPNSGTTRKMMTFSIDSSRVNKVGFSPSGPTFSVRGPNNQAGSTDSENSRVSSGASGQISSEWDSSENAFGEALGLKISNRTDVEVNESNSSGSSVNVLAMAAKEAGLSLGSPMTDILQEHHQKSPCEDSQTLIDGCAALTDMLSSSSQTRQVTDSATDITALPTVQLDNSQSSFTSDSNLITNDVALPIRPPTPSVDSLLASLEMSQDAIESSKENTFLPQSGLDSLVCMNDGSSAPLSMPVLDLPMTPQKSVASSPVHPWSINCNSRDGLGTFTTLNTPQRILPSDTEDSMDGSLYASKQQRSSAELENDATTSLFNDSEVDLQMQCLMSENSVDFMAKFQELIRQDETNEKYENPAAAASSFDVNDTSVSQGNDQNRKGDG